MIWYIYISPRLKYSPFILHQCISFFLHKQVGSLYILFHGCVQRGEWDHKRELSDWGYNKKVFLSEGHRLGHLLHIFFHLLGIISFLLSWSYVRSMHTNQWFVVFFQFLELEFEFESKWFLQGWFHGRFLFFLKDAKSKEIYFFFIWTLFSNGKSDDFGEIRCFLDIQACKIKMQVLEGYNHKALLLINFNYPHSYEGFHRSQNPHFACSLSADLWN